MALDADFTSPSFNCYVTVAEADSYMSERLHTEEWVAATTANKTAALIWASKMLDNMFTWTGQRVAVDQPMGFPRYGLYDKDGFWIESDVIPKQIKSATIEQAFLLLQDDRTTFSDAGKSDLNSLSVGSISLAFQGNGQNSKPVASDYVRTILTGLYDVVNSPGSSARVVRT